MPVQGQAIPQASRSQVTRRTLLRFLLGAGVVRWVTPRLQAAKMLPVDKLVADYAGERRLLHERRFRAHAYVHLFALPIFSRQDVGGGYAIVEESNLGDRSIRCLQFAGGSSGERTHGLNRVGLIQEAVVEQRGGPVESAYFGFMVSSAEKNLEQARKSLQADGASAIPYSAASGSGHNGLFTCTVSHLPVPAHFNWSTFDQLNEGIRILLTGSADTKRFDVRLDTPSSRPETFLYSMRRAILSPARRTTDTIVYNGKRYILTTEKQADRRIGQQLATRGVTHNPDTIWRLNGTTTETVTREATSFEIWYQRGDESGIPVRIEFYPKSFLKLVFEQSETKQGPKLTYLLEKGEMPRMAAR